MNSETDRFKVKVTQDQVVSAWASVNPDERMTQKLAIVASQLGVSPMTVRRHLDKAGLIGGSPVVQEARQAAGRLLQVLMPHTQAERAGALLLADIINRQRTRVADLASTVDRLSLAVRQLTEAPLDEAGNPCPIPEESIHKASATAARLVDAAVKLHQEERDCWGISKDAGSSYAQTLDELAHTPHPSGTPPIDFSGT